MTSLSETLVRLVKNYRGERRLYSRENVNSKGHMTVANDTFPVTLIDLSRDGARVNIDDAAVRHLEKGEKANLVLTSPDRKLGDLLDLQVSLAYIGDNEIGVHIDSINH